LPYADDDTGVNLEGDWQLNERAVPMAAIKQPRPPLSLNRHAGNTTEQYPGEVSLIAAKLSLIGNHKWFGVTLNMGKCT